MVSGECLGKSQVTLANSLQCRHLYKSRSLQFIHSYLQMLQLESNKAKRLVAILKYKFFTSNIFQLVAFWTCLLLKVDIEKFDKHVGFLKSIVLVLHLQQTRFRSCLHWSKSALFFSNIQRLR